MAFRYRQVKTGGRPAPAPEIAAAARRVIPGPWAVGDRARGGRTNMVERRFEAPWGPAALDRAVRFHELLHLRYSPPDPTQVAAAATAAGATFETVNAVEDGRIQLRGGAELVGARRILSGMGDCDGPDPEELPLRDVLRLAMCTLGTPAHVRYRDALNAGAGRGLYRRVRRLLEADAAPFATTLAVAALIDTETDALDDIGDDGPLAEVAQQVARRVTERAEAWGDLTIETPPRPLPACPASAAARWRAAPYGGPVRAPHRLLTDGALCGLRRRVRGGTILVDHSGSMHLDVVDLLAVVTAAPAATIADYCGEEDVGVLRILVAHGRRVADDTLDAPYGGNVVDGPATVWLARQPAPRLWVTDGHATGRGGDRFASTALFAELARTCQRADITIVSRLADVPAVLTAR